MAKAGYRYGYSLHIAVSDYSQWRVGNIGPIDLPNTYNDSTFYYETVNSFWSLGHYYHYWRKYWLHDSSATLANAIDGILKIREEVASGDIVVITFAGHAGTSEDFNCDEESRGYYENNGIIKTVPDWQDTGYCLYDNKYFTDDMITFLLKTFPAGVRIFVVSDCCHSGSMVDTTTHNQLTLSDATTMINELKKVDSARSKKLLELYDLYKDKSMKANVITLGAVWEERLEDETGNHGTLTHGIKKVWDNGNFKGGIQKFHSELVQEIWPLALKKAASISGVTVENLNINAVTPFLPKLEQIHPWSKEFNDQRPFEVYPTN